jgi:hypothetical protein
MGSSSLSLPSHEFSNVRLLDELLDFVEWLLIESGRLDAVHIESL